MRQWANWVCGADALSEGTSPIRLRRAAWRMSLSERATTGMRSGREPFTSAHNVAKDVFKVNLQSYRPDAEHGADVYT